MQTLVDKTEDRLLTLRAERDTIAAAFDLSFASLTAPQQRLFTLLGLHPGVEIDDHAAIALSGLSRRDMQAALEDLYNARLLTEPSSEHPGRYGMHDLIRSYVHDRAVMLDANEQLRALSQLLEYYQQAAENANKFLAQGHPPGAREAR
jgi:hypothetical protein